MTTTEQIESINKAFYPTDFNHLQVIVVNWLEAGVSVEDIRESIDLALAMIIQVHETIIKGDIVTELTETLAKINRGRSAQ